MGGQTSGRRWLAAALCAVICIAGTGGVLLGVQAAQPGEEPEKEFIKWMEFEVPYAALNKALSTAVAAYEREIPLDMPTILGYLAAKYWGNWGSYRSKDIDELYEKVVAGESIESLTADMKDFPYFCECYDAVLCGFVGPYSIELPDENGEPMWQEKYGLKAFFPIAEGFDYSHSDDFGNARSYGYRRSHLGNDLMGTVGTPIVAVESGVVETLGWNQYGGWRIGIRSFDRRRYYYYAHLRKDAPYAKGLREGQVVTAGNVIGYMGQTGYSTTENVNNITVPHLHFGLQIIFDESQKESDNELWIDVYQLMNLLERNRATVMRDETTRQYTRRYQFIDPSAEEYKRQMPEGETGPAGPLAGTQ